MSFFWFRGCRERIHTKLDSIVGQLNQLLGRIIDMSDSLEALKLEVAKNTSVAASALALIRGLRQQIIDAGTDPAELQALVDTLAGSDADLAKAVSENTVAAPGVQLPGAATPPPAAIP